MTSVLTGFLTRELGLAQNDIHALIAAFARRFGCAALKDMERCVLQHPDRGQVRHMIAVDLCSDNWDRTPLKLTTTWWQQPCPTGIH